MSIHKSLKAKGALTRHRNVLNRTERFQTLLTEGKVDDDSSVYGLPKMRSIMAKAKAKVKAEAAPAAGAVPGAPGAAPAAVAAPAAGAKGAPAAAAGKVAAPAAAAKPGGKK